MAWYVSLIICFAMFVAGCAFTWLCCKNKINDATSGYLFITKSNNQPFLAASVPMESISKQKTVSFVVRVVDDSQK